MNEHKRENKRKHELVNCKLNFCKKSLDEDIYIGYNLFCAFNENGTWSYLFGIANILGGNHMSTTLAKPATVERKWYIIDAAGKPMGRTAVIAANLLRGKNKVTFTPNVDCGDHVIIINCDKAVLTGKKLDQKFYYHHSGWIGGMKAVKASTMMAENSPKAMTLAVKGMLPGNKLGASALRRLRVYKGAEHENTAQKPEAYTL